jgi:hypothetical protein
MGNPLGVDAAAGASRPPAVGDGFYKATKRAKDGMGYLREVTRSHGGFVFYEQDNGWTVRRKIVTIKKWQEWAATAEYLGPADGAAATDAASTPKP